MDKIYVLAGDIGGTKSILRLYASGKSGRVVYASETFSSREAGGRKYVLTFKRGD